MAAAQPTVEGRVCSSYFPEPVEGGSGAGGQRGAHFAYPRGHLYTRCACGPCSIVQPVFCSRGRPCWRSGSEKSGLREPSSAERAHGRPRTDGESFILKLVHSAVHRLLELAQLLARVHHVVLHALQRERVGLLHALQRLQGEGATG